MTHDPYRLHAELSCPCCCVKGKVVSDEREDEDEFEEPYVCVECGASWRDAGVVGDVKEYRVQYMRLVEGRPYEPPRPRERERDPYEPPDLTAFDKMLADRWRKDIEERAKQPPLDFSKLKKSAHTWATSGPVERSIGLSLVERAKAMAEWTTMGDWMDRAAKLGEDDTE